MPPIRTPHKCHQWEPGVGSGDYVFPSIFVIPILINLYINRLIISINCV